MYAPLSARHDFSGASLGQELWSVSIILLGLSSILGSLNYIPTVIINRAPGMTWFRLPLSVWSLFITAILGLLALPVLSGAAIMLLFDQVLNTHFFDTTAGGQALLWQHLFWFFGHPEVYILILPAMGMVSDIIANGSRKPIFGYHSMVFAIVAIGFLGWIVWGHHMFVSGMNPTLGSSFMVSTLIIAVPSAVKVFNWMGTSWGGKIGFQVPILHGGALVAWLAFGGRSGISMAATPGACKTHDTYSSLPPCTTCSSGGACGGDRRPRRTHGRTTDSSGRSRPPRRTATGRRCPPCTAGPTSSARRRWRRTTCRSTRSCPPTVSRPPHRPPPTDRERGR